MMRIKEIGIQSLESKGVGLRNLNSFLPVIIFTSINSKLWASLVAQRLKCLPPMRETRVWSLGRKDPLETGSQRVGHDWATSPSPSSSFKRHWSILDRKRNWLWYAPVLAQIHSDRSSEKLPVSVHPSHSSRCGWLQPQVLATQYKSGLKLVSNLVLSDMTTETRY